jgi:hypothetical protein
MAIEADRAYSKCCEATMAAYLARKAVETQLRARRRKIQEFRASELAIAARDYLASHPELIEQARAYCAELDTFAPSVVRQAGLDAMATSAHVKASDPAGGLSAVAERAVA